MTLIQRLIHEAQSHANEARTANATIAEIYQVCSKSTGEAGNWHGAEPVRQRIRELEAQAASLGKKVEIAEAVIQDYYLTDEYIAALREQS